MNANEFKQIFPLGDKNDVYARFFIGQSYVKTLASGQISAVNVTFEPGCRNNWHIHRGGGQLLLCTAGSGWYQEEGRPALRLGPGDVVNLPADEKHWHGAAANEWFSHLSISVPSANTSMEWFEAVCDEAYAKISTRNEA